ncbi:glycosyltransferase family 2 protein [Thalassobellus citreus]|uniref:glycosyltransferase family 2 protein n=1 Tax=Thalassobellus citreus TaxID=3367752 RepID=UPI0037AE77E3
MNTAMNLVSIVMATYNRDKYILEALQSIQNQSFTNWECLIIDDGGTDNTQNVITPILEKDNRFCFLKRPKTYKKGLSGARNYGIDTAKGAYIIFFDDDDVVHPLNLEICLSILKKTKRIAFCNYQKKSFSKQFNYNIIDHKLSFKLETIDKTFLHKVITNEIPFASCTVLWKKECFVKHRFNESLMYAEEWECYSRILSEEIKGVVIDKILYYNRKHDASNTGEFWSKSGKRVASKKKAIELVVFNLKKKNLLYPNSYSYLLNLAISFRDFKLLQSIFTISNPKKEVKLFYGIKFCLYPLWVFYKKNLKK